ncbi:putative receptor-like protein kinase [Vitis vinifera]|uniref:Putative receptor-like protein kinase n=1 Tax=Vitis vinifera TaxID=29760 RepID=A0A438EPW8_VITVI|nr:putative receptor-like protein kinase [Vitis vinifera]
MLVSEPPPPVHTPEVSPSPLVAASPSQVVSTVTRDENHHPYHLTLIPGVGIAVTAVAVIMLVVLIILIRKKNRELENFENTGKTSSKDFPPPPRPIRKLQEGSSSMFQKYSYKETKKATNNFNTIVGQGGFGTVYKAQFRDGSVAAVKRMNKVSEQGEDEFCQEIELLARLHHRHLVALRGFCIEKHNRFLMYEYMENGSLKDHLHCMLFPLLLLYLLIPPLLLFLFLFFCWRLRLLLLVLNVLCRRLFLVQGSVFFFCWFECFLLEVNHSAGACVWGQVLLLLLVLSVLCWRLIIVQECVCGVRCDGDVPGLLLCPAPGRTPLSWQTRIQIAIDVANALEYLHFYCDPPLCHRDIKSSNILLDENFVAKVADFGLAHASKDGSICFEPVNTDVRGTPGYMDPEYVITRELTEKSDVYSYGVVLLELVTARRAIQDNKNLLQTVVTIVRWCTQREARARPSIKQVLRLLYESSDPMHNGFVQAVEDEEYEETEERGRTSKGKMNRGDGIFHSGDGRCLASSSSTSRSYCSRSFLLENGSPQSPSGSMEPQLLFDRSMMSVSHQMTYWEINFLPYWDLMQQ